jgi:xanthine dehydrogenase/oxidase
LEDTKTIIFLPIFQYVLGLSPPNLPENLVTGGKILERPVSTGKQDFETNKSVWPLNKPVPKLEAVIQCSGKTELGCSTHLHNVNVLAVKVLIPRL